MQPIVDYNLVESAIRQLHQDIRRERYAALIRKCGLKRVRRSGRWIEERRESILGRVRSVRQTSQTIGLLIRLVVRRIHVPDHASQHPMLGLDAPDRRGYL